jgi:hypothetical protein
MTDDLEMLLRDHYRRAAEDLHPGPGLIHRAQAAGAGHRRRRLWPFAVAVGTAAVVLAVPLLMVVTAGSGTPARPAGGMTGPAQRERPITLRLDRTVAPAGATVRLTVEAGTPLGVYLRIGGHWQHAGEVTPVGGRFAGGVVVRHDTSAIRVCPPVPARCSAALGLVVVSPAVTPTAPRALPLPTGPGPVISPQPHTPRPGQGTPGIPTPVGSWPAVTPRPGR